MASFCGSRTDGVMSSLEEVRKERWKDRGGKKPSGRTLGASKKDLDTPSPGQWRHARRNKTEGNLEFPLLGV